MLTTDLALRMDPAYEQISRRFHEHPEEFADAFAKAWFKLTHRDMGPKVRYLGSLVPKETLIWQDPIPAVDHMLIGSGHRSAESEDPGFGTIGSGTSLDGLGFGLDFPRLRQTRRRQWCAHPSGAAEELGGEQSARTQRRRCWRSSRHPEGVQCLATGGKKVSLADLIVLGGSAAIEKAAKDAGPQREGSLHARSHGCHSGADGPELIRPLKPKADGFRNYHGERAIDDARRSAHRQAQLLTLTAPEMTVLIGGMRVLGTNAEQSKYGVFTKTPGNVDQRLLRQPARHAHGMEADQGAEAYEGRDRKTGKVKWTATRVDLFSARTRNCARWPRFMPTPTRRKSS